MCILIWTEYIINVSLNKLCKYMIILTSTTLYKLGHQTSGKVVGNSEMSDWMVPQVNRLTQVIPGITTEHHKKDPSQASMGTDSTLLETWLCKSYSYKDTNNKTTVYKSNLALSFFMLYLISWHFWKCKCSFWWKQLHLMIVKQDKKPIWNVV